MASPKDDMLSSAALGTAALQTNRQSRVRNEQTLQQLEGYLGSEEQANAPESTGKLAPYQQRYSIDLGSLGAAGADPLRIWAEQQAGVGGGFDNYAKAANAGISKANEIMAEAEAAAKAGDFGKAESLRKDADFYINSYGPKGIPAGVWQQSISMQGDPNQQARSLGDTPSGKIVGSLLRDARQLLDPTSDAYNRFYDSLTSGPIAEVKAGVLTGERGVAMEARGIQQAQSEREAQLGGVRDPYATQAMNERAMDAAAGKTADLELKGATAIAQIKSDSTQWLETFKRNYAENAVGFARAWAEGSPGIRKEFQDSLTNLAQMTVALSSNLTQNFTDLTKVKMAMAQAQRQLIPELTASVAGAALGFAAQYYGRAGTTGLGGGTGSMGGVTSGGSSTAPAAGSTNTTMNDVSSALQVVGTVASIAMMFA